MRLHVLHVVPVVLLALPTTARAETDEWRMAASAQAQSITLDGLGASASSATVGGAASLGRGLYDHLELTMDVGYAQRPNLIIAEPRLDGVFGSDLHAYVNAHWLSAAVGTHLSLIAGRPAIATVLHPTLDVRAGVALRWLRRAEVFDDAGGRISAAPSERTPVAFLGTRLGLTYRATDYLAVGLLATAELGTAGHRSTGVTLELSWLMYELF